MPRPKRLGTQAISMTSRWVTTSRPGWATRSSTGSSSPSSAGCMPGRPGSCRCAPACRRCSPRRRGASPSPRRARGDGRPQQQSAPLDVARGVGRLPGAGLRRARRRGGAAGRGAHRVAARPRRARSAAAPSSASCTASRTRPDAALVGRRRARSRDPERLRADAVVLAVPAAPASRLLAPHLPDAARALREIEYASMAIVTLAVGAGRTATTPAAPGLGLPRAGGRGAHHQGQHLLVDEVGAGPPRPPATCPSCAPRSGGYGETIGPAAPRRGAGRDRRRRGQRGPGAPAAADRRHPRPALGRGPAAVHRRPRRPGRPDPGRRRRPRPGWSWPARHTRGWGSRRASRAGARRRRRWLTHLRERAGGRGRIGA